MERRLKVLPLQYWMGDSFFMEDMDLASIQPVIGRDGYYSDNKKAWFERNGNAWLYDLKAFNYELRLLSALDLRPEEVEGLRAIYNTRFATPKQKSLFGDYTDAVMIRATRRRARIDIFRDSLNNLM